MKVWNATAAVAVYEQPKQQGSLHAKEISSLLSLRSSHAIVAATADCRLVTLRCSATALKTRHQLIGNSDEVTCVKFMKSAAPLQPSTVASGLAGVSLPAATPPQVAVATNSDQIHVFSCADMNCDVTLVGHSDTVLCLTVTQLKV